MGRGRVRIRIDSDGVFNAMKGGMRMADLGFGFSFVCVLAFALPFPLCLLCYSSRRGFRAYCPLECRGHLPTLRI